VREQPASRPLYLGAGPSASFAIFHPPAAGAPVRTPVLISPPWGWDEVASYLGLRSAAVADGHFLLNDRPCYLRSVLSQGFWPSSHLAAPGEQAIEDEVRLILSLGFNAARRSLGMLVANVQ